MCQQKVVFDSLSSTFSAYTKCSRWDLWSCWSAWGVTLHKCGSKESCTWATVQILARKNCCCWTQGPALQGHLLPPKERGFSRDRDPWWVFTQWTFIFQYSQLHLLEQHQHSPRDSESCPGNHSAFLDFSEETELFICISSELCWKGTFWFLPLKQIWNNLKMLGH